MTTMTIDPLEQLLTHEPPPCEAFVNDEPCRNPAVWRVIFRSCCITPVTLFCTPCLDEFGKLPSAACNLCHTTYMPATSAILSGYPI